MSQAINQVIPKGYKQTDVGVIPKDWTLKTIREIASVSSGGTPNREISEFWDGDIPWITTTLINGDVISNANEFITRKGLENSSAKMCASGTILMAMYGQGKTRGKVGLLSFDASINQACAAISLHNKSSNQYVLHVLNSMYDEIRDLSNSGGQENLSGGIIKNIALPFPSCEEQTAIANALSDMDALLSELENLMAKKQAIKTATMQQLLTGKTRLPQFAFYSGINSTEDAVKGKRNNPSATIVNAGASDDGALASQDSGDMDSLRKNTKVSELGEIPEDWQVYKIGSVLSITTGSRNTQDKLAEGQYPFFVRSQTVERINTYSFDGEAVLTAGDGVGTGKIFHYINGKFDYHQRVYLMHNFGEKIDGYFFYIYFSNFFYDRIMSMTAKSSVDSVRREMIADMLITLPPKEEQTAIASILSDMDNEIQTLEQRLSKTRQIKQGMMQELLTGKTRLPFDKDTTSEVSV
jgi:type I restriction enzyme, S subunit